MSKVEKYLFKNVSNAPLVILRIAFGSLLLFSTLRSIYKGWVEELYILPDYHFTFFDFLEVADPASMIAIFWLMALSALCLVLGLFYRFNTILFFLLFTYVELIDKTYYLNHYYLVCLLTFWLAIVPAHRRFSIDCLLFPNIYTTQCRQWNIGIFKVQLSIVYFFAGLAKVNYDWLFRAQPLATWLPGLYQIPLLGNFMHLKWIAFAFSWAGCLYDLSIWVFLWFKKSRAYAYFFVIVFHLLTAVLFPRIGMFPLIMVTTTIIFFSEEWHERKLKLLTKLFSRAKQTEKVRELNIPSRPLKRWIAYSLMVYLLIQIVLPFRYTLFPGNLFWNEYGYRFSWRVMLMEKNGFTTFILKDPKTQVQQEVDQALYLTAFQRQQLRSQPDMIYQFAQHIGDEFKEKHSYEPEVYVQSRISLNGRRSREFTYDTVDLYHANDRIIYSWLKPFDAP